jgi:hypothetical protein
MKKKIKKSLGEGWKLPPFFVSLGMEKKKELVKLLMQFQNDLNAFDGDVVNTWSIEGLSEELDELITQTSEEIEDEEEED